MTKWEYRMEPVWNLHLRERVTRASTREDRMNAVNEWNTYGAEGWELVAFRPAGADWLAVFKRPVGQT